MDDDHACGHFKFLLNIVVIKFDGHEATGLTLYWCFMYAFQFVLKNISKSILLDILNIDNHITSILHPSPPLY